jgi:hypothetical protein
MKTPNHFSNTLLQGSLFACVTLAFFMSSCGTKPETKNADSLTDSVPLVKTETAVISQTDSLHETFVDSNTLLAVDTWKNADFIISAKHKKSEGVLRTIANTRAEWKNVPNPFIAVYRGCDFGDYFHLTFEDNKGKNYDFGFGNNNFGTYTLFDSEQYNDNKKYLNKSFRVFWNWTPSSFPCCDGEYEKVEAFMPSITKLELMDTR